MRDQAKTMGMPNWVIFLLISQFIFQGSWKTMGKWT
jgi:hypothetical protein